MPKRSKYPTNLAGMKFGRLTAINPTENLGNGRVKWLCRCDCGNSVEVLNYNLYNNHTQSCGCLQRERAAELNAMHGMCGTRLHRIWRHMRERCLKEYSKRYCDYGGRGITLCDEWLEFEPFMRWALDNGYADHLTIERINNNKGYSPENCRWATPFEQASNKRSNHLFTIDGVTDTMTNWARAYGINPMLVFDRLHKGWTEYEALTIPKGEGRCRR